MGLPFENPLEGTKAQESGQKYSNFEPDLNAITHPLFIEMFSFMIKLIENQKTIAF